MNLIKPDLRRTILVERGTQFRFARFVILFAIGTAVVTSTVVFLVTSSLLGERLAGVYPQGRLVEIFRKVYLLFGLVLLISIPAIFYLSIRFSHRFVGPLPKIYRTLKEVGEGNLDQELKLRKHDELTELAAVINEMIRNLKASRDKGPKP